MGLRMTTKLHGGLNCIVLSPIVVVVVVVVVIVVVVVADILGALRVSSFFPYTTL